MVLFTRNVKIKLAAHDDSDTDGTCKRGFMPSRYYRPQRSWGKVIFSQASVILCTGGSASARLGTPPGPGTPPAQTPRDHPPPEQSILGDTFSERAVCILLECNLVSFLCLILNNLLFSRVLVKHAGPTMKSRHFLSSGKSLQLLSWQILRTNDN